MDTTALGLQGAHSFSEPTSGLRKLSEAVFRAIYRVTHGRAYRHSDRLWHHFKLQRDAQGAIRALTYRGTPVPLLNGQLQPCGNAGPVHLIATGPSIAQIDYHQLPIETAIGVNGAIALYERAPVRFDYYCMIDTNFVKSRRDLVERIITQDLILFMTPLVLFYMLKFFRLETFRCKIFLIEDICLPTFGPQRDNAALAAYAGGDVHQFSPDSQLGVSFDITRGYFDSKTVAFTALQVLTWLGYKDIYIHGMDLSNTRTLPRFYERRETMQPSSIEQDFDDYIEPSFRLAQPLLRAHGVRVVNLSLTSALDSAIFPKQHWSSLCDRHETTPRRTTA